MPRQSTVAREIRRIRTSFVQIARSFGRLEPFLTAVPENGGEYETGTARPGRKLRLSAARRRALKLQGT